MKYKIVLDDLHAITESLVFALLDELLERLPDKANSRRQFLPCCSIIHAHHCHWLRCQDIILRVSIDQLFSVQQSMVVEQATTAVLPHLDQRQGVYKSQLGFKPATSRLPLSYAKNEHLAALASTSNPQRLEFGFRMP